MFEQRNYFESVCSNSGDYLALDYILSFITSYSVPLLVWLQAHRLPCCF